ncbi:MAG: hypothetical protein N3G48_06175 [Sulfolobales archaeon]|nr:hypothetical protein [Sulfolobales archaeon]
MGYSISDDTLKRAIKGLIDSWLDDVFGPLYHFTYRFKLSRFQGSPPEVLIMENPKSLYIATVKMFDNELVAESFLCTLLTYFRRSGFENTPPCELFINWFKNNDVNSIISLMKSYLDSRKKGFGRLE